MDDPNTPSQNPPVPSADAEEQKMLDELKNLEHEEKSEVEADSEVIDKREEEGKELEKEEQNPTQVLPPNKPPENQH